MNTEHLKCVLAVAHCGSMNRAAKQLFLTQPTVGAAVSSVEKELGFPLFIRTKDGCVLTKTGEEIIGQIQAVVDQVDRWIGQDKALPDSAAVYIINNSEIGFSGILREVLVTFREMYPNINIYQSIDRYFPEKKDSCKQNIIITPTVSDNPQPQRDMRSAHWDERTLYSDHFIAYLRPDHPLAGGSSISIGKLRGETIAIPMNDEPMENTIFWQRAGQFNRILRYGDSESVMEAVAQGGCIGILTSGSVRNNYLLQSRCLCTASFDDLDSTISHTLYSRKPHYLSSAEKILLAYILRHFSGDSAPRA